LLLNALKAVGIVPDKEERPTGYYADIDSALRQQRAMAMGHSHEIHKSLGPDALSGQNAFGALGGGLGSVFGP